ncbi:MAG: N-6 DNA methylase [Thermodesulfovibrionales bacterium]
MSESLTKEFESGLRDFDMLESPGLILVDAEPADSYQRIALENAKKYKADAVYFRLFENGRPPLPQIYIYDFTKVEKDDDEVAELHKRLWNSGQVPLFFVFDKTEVKIFNSLKQPQIKAGRIVYSPLDTIKLAGQIQEQLKKDFSSRNFDNGAFWEISKYKDKFKLNESAYEKLLARLKQNKRELIAQKVLPEEELIHKLLVLAILIKYLEEREDEKGNKVFPQNFFSQFAKGARTFADIWKVKGACLRLFDYLAGHFNGEIFRVYDDEERQTLLAADLSSFAVFIEGKTEDSGQIALWELYSFNDLPIELISNIYEEFLGSEKGVVYTPPYLVNFVLDEAMPMNEPKNNYKVLDPACGSGVFLVAAYRRIIHWWRIQNEWKRPSLRILKKLLRESIYGVDKSGEAVRLAIFSLSLALCDELSPKVIWEELKFDDLQKEGNLFDKDFFELLHQKELKAEFDLVIGNPPFIESFNTPYAEQIEMERRKVRAAVPGNQLALLFLDQAITMCKKGGLLSLILPAGPFLYNKNSFEFRSHFLKEYHVKQVLDFTALSSVLFGKANVAVAVVFAKKELPKSKHLSHITVRRTKPAKEKMYFELDHYDFHQIPYRAALYEKIVWKENLLGGGRLHQLISRFAPARSLGEYLRDREKEANWVIREGFTIGDEDRINKLKQYERQKDSLSREEENEFKALKAKYKKADYLTGKKTLPSEAFTEKGIDEKQIHIQEEQYFQWPREKKIYEPHHLLIKEGVSAGSIPVAYRSDYLSFKHDVIGIHAPANQREELGEIERRIKNNKFYLFCAAALSGRYMISRATSILKDDILNLPYPEDETELDLSATEQILVDDVIDYLLEFRRKGENSLAAAPVMSEQLRQFGATYCKVLNSVYKKFVPFTPAKSSSYVCFPFYYGEKPDIDVNDIVTLEKSLNKLIKRQHHPSLRITRVLRIYDHNIVYLIKPVQTRYWLRSVAIRDADETFDDLVKQGY